MLGPTRSTGGTKWRPEASRRPPPGPVCSSRATISSIAAFDGAQTSTCSGGASAFPPRRWRCASVAAAGSVSVWGDEGTVSLSGKLDATIEELKLRTESGASMSATSVSAVADDKAAEVVEAIQNSANTGKIGDGKVFVYDLESAVRIRTGEQYNDAL